MRKVQNSQVKSGAAAVLLTDLASRGYRVVSLSELVDAGRRVN